jgi:hypothetical protein
MLLSDLCSRPSSNNYNAFGVDHENEVPPSAATKQERQSSVETYFGALRPLGK